MSRQGQLSSLEVELEEARRRCRELSKVAVKSKEGLPHLGPNLDEGKRALEELLNLHSTMKKY